MANDVHKIKLLLLWDILCKNTDEDHALNTDEIANLLALRGVNVSRKILVQDIATLCDNGYEVLSYKKSYHHYYVVNRALETAEVVMLADVINASKLPAAQKKALAQRLAETLCSHQAENISKHIVSLDYMMLIAPDVEVSEDSTEWLFLNSLLWSTAEYAFNEKDTITVSDTIL